jgi:hypothetical protein
MSAMYFRPLWQVFASRWGGRKQEAAKYMILLLQIPSFPYFSPKGK